jgi:hypothetical protein
MSRNTAELNQLSDSLRLHSSSIAEYFTESTAVETYPDQYNLTPYDTLLMPTDIQYKIKQHLAANADLIPQILQKHADINDDIQFDNHSYSVLKSQLLEENK